MAHTITIVQGHPDAGGEHLCHALAAAYREGAEGAGHTVHELCVARMEFPLIRSREDFVDGARPPCIQQAQQAIQACRHLVLVYPLWQGTMPALLKAFIEQVFRYDFAFEPRGDGRFEKKLTGRSARVVITMGMPALAYRWYFRAHSLKSLERNILRFAGFSPVRDSLFGMVEEAPTGRREKWFRRMRRLGERGE